MAAMSIIMIMSITTSTSIIITLSITTRITMSIKINMSINMSITIPMGNIFVNSMSNCEVSMEPTTVGIQGGIIRPAARFSKSISLHM